MDTLLLSRLQFGITTIYHFFFVPLTIGLSFLIAIMETMYVKTGDERYKQMTKFWGKLFLINFSMGVVTGIVQEFQFGMNWSNYSRFVGDIFGAPLAIEALVAFFIESTFLGIWIFGWNKVSKKIHLLSIWLTSIATAISAFWILLANSFMQNPVGYTLNNGRAEMTDFGALLANGHLWWQYPHVLTASLCTAGFFITGISAINLVKKSNKGFFEKSFRFGAIAALIGTVLVIFAGHEQTRSLSHEQPMKLAAAEALWETADPAPFSFVSIIDQENRTNTAELSIPGGLSFLLNYSFSGEVQGLNDLQAKAEAEYGPGNYLPPVAVVFYAFRVMVGAGGLMLILGIAALVMIRKKKEYVDYKKLLFFFSWAWLLPYIANSAGWIMAEMGRFPWVVYGLQTMADGVSQVTDVPSLLISLIGYVAIYTILAVVTIYLMKRYGIKNPETDSEIVSEENQGGKGVSLWT